MDTVDQFTVGKPPEISNQELFDQMMGSVGDTAETVGRQRITRETIDELTKGLPPDRKTKVAGILAKYEGWTWKAALDAHSAKKAVGP